MEIKKIGCVGAGLIGSCWATLYSSMGIDVIIHDISEDILDNSISRIESNLNFLMKNNLLKDYTVKTALKRIKPTLNLAEAVSQVDYVTESVPDSYSIKKNVYREMDELTSESTILASSSSGLLMSEIQKVTKKPERCVMTHPILPPHLIPLIEIVGGEMTSKDTIIKTRDFMVQLGKTPIVLCKEVPGYIVNRLQAALLREAISLVANGVASANDVDRAFCMGVGLRDPIFGPYLRAHVTGGGIESFIDNFHQSYKIRWKSLETWTEIPKSAIEKVLQSVNEMKVIRTKSLNEIESLRDEKLIQILQLMRKHPFY
ncbi:MAG: 3-hydroxyacyl-CoA dehydrogenase NAD-binding domain-containing protein [Candidatus Bathyarchaeia archaeon]